MGKWPRTNRYVIVIAEMWNAIWEIEKEKKIEHWNETWNRIGWSSPMLPKWMQINYYDLNETTTHFETGHSRKTLRNITVLYSNND